MNTPLASAPGMNTELQPRPADAQKLKIVIVGHVDHGKSTLVGRLCFDTDSLPQGKVEQIRKACEAEGMEFEYAFLLDALLEEQEQNITIDTTQIQFRTAKRQYVIIDAPGHKEFLKNMVTGAAHADAAILLIDAKEGVQEQSRRHGYLLSLLGIRQVVVAVNKMDLVGYNPEVFRSITQAYGAFLAELGVQPRAFIPISAKLGENIARRSERMPWSDGVPILEALDQFELPPSGDDLPLRLVVQDIYRFDERRIVAGRVEAGRLRVGDELIFWPDRKRSTVKSIESWPRPNRETEAGCGRSVGITLTEQIFVERGQVATRNHEVMVEGREFKAKLFWLENEPLVLNEPVTLKLATAEVEARVVEMTRVLDSASLDVHQARDLIQKNEAAEVRIRLRKPLAFDNVDRIQETGRFVLFKGKRIGGGGIIFDAHYPSSASQPVTSANLSWTAHEVTAEARIDHFGHRGAVVWLTGFSGAGKSTLAIALEAALLRRGVAAFVLDGDNLRHGLCSDLGFSDRDRAENIRRAGEVAKLMAEAGLVVISALISPFAAERARVRNQCEAVGIPFCEVFVNAPLEVCEQRDPKQLYAKARRGEIRGFTGIDAPYEPPAQPDLEIRTDQLDRETCLALLGQRVLELTRKTDPGSSSPVI
ncbi:MAG: adenylyl-sulfate kinase [Candidatus Methylacidiphilales bacterium]